MPLDGRTPCSWQPRPGPSRCVWRSTSQASPCTCSPAQLQAQFSFLFNPQINMCSYIFNREAVYIRVGISFTSFSPLLRRHLTLTWKTGRLMRERPRRGTPAKSEKLRASLPGLPSLLPGPCCPAAFQLSLSLSPSLPPTPHPQNLQVVLAQGTSLGPFQTCSPPFPS